MKNVSLLRCHLRFTRELYSWARARMTAVREDPILLCRTLNGTTGAGRINHEPRLGALVSDFLDPTHPGFLLHLLSSHQEHHGRCSMWPLQSSTVIPEADVHRQDSTTGQACCTTSTSGGKYTQKAIILRRSDKLCAELSIRSRPKCWQT